MLTICEFKWSPRRSSPSGIITFVMVIVLKALLKNV